MWSGIPLFPEQASTIAVDVDNVYLFVVAVTAFFAVLVSVLVVVFAGLTGSVFFTTDQAMRDLAERT